MITTLWMFYPCFEWLFYTRAAAASTMFSPQSFSLCSVLVQLAIHFPKVLPKHIYICPAYVRCGCCTRGLLVKKCTRLHEHQFCPNCTSETEFVPKFVQVSHIFCFRCLPSDPPNCDTHSESKVDSPSNMYLSSHWHLVKGSCTEKMWKFRKRTYFSSWSRSVIVPIFLAL